MLLVGINAKFIHSNLAIRYLSKVDSRWSFCEYTIQDRPEHIAADLYRTGHRVFFFSCYIWNIELVLKICSILKQADEKLQLGLGGPEVSFDPEQILEKNPSVDYILCGEGEPAICALTEGLLSHELRNVPGLVYRWESEIKRSSYPAAEADMETLPFPYLPEELPQLVHRILYFETSRGCPYRCAFCLSGSAGSLRFLPLSRVSEAIDFFAEHNIPLVKLVDRTFNADPKRALAIVEAIKARGGTTTYHFEIRAETMTEALIQSLQSAPKGMFQLEIGVQSVNPTVLRGINRSPGFEKLSSVVRALLKNQNMHLHLDLIAGLPGESLEAFIYSFNQVIRLRPHALQLGFLKKLKGAALSAANSAFCAFPPYEVIHSDAMSYAELLRLKAAEDMLECLYNSGAFETTVSYLLDTYYIGREFEFFAETAAYFSKKAGQQSQKTLFEELYRFAARRFNDQAITHRLVYDYCLTHRDSLSFMESGERLKEQAFTFLKQPERVTHYFAHFAGEKPVVLYKKIRFVPIGGRVIAFDYENGGAVDVTAEFE